MNFSKGQGELFQQEDHFDHSIKTNDQLLLNKQAIEKWQRRIYSHQKSLFKNIHVTEVQKSIFESSKKEEHFETNDFLKLTPLSLNFWRWPTSPHHGPAIYLVMDKPKTLDSNILLYIGETISAEKRWKGEHDCKNYLQAYSEACQRNEIANQLSIRFWKDVPKDTKERRKLEQILIKKWLPAFNKETKSIWNTPFTNEIP